MTSKKPGCANRTNAAVQKTQPNSETLASKSGEEMAGTSVPGLYIVSTPIGNLGDISSRAIKTLSSVDLIACEDTRVTGKLLHRFGISTPMIPYHDHNAAKMRPDILARMIKGESVALVSDAGTPLLSDPGYKLVQETTNSGVSVFAIPGPSALLAALAVAALPTDRVLFAGFLPPKSGKRREVIEEFKSIQATLVFYESTQRLAASLGDLEDVLGARSAAVCRELTKLYEETRRGTLSELASHYANSDTPKGEIVIVVGPPDDDENKLTERDIDQELELALSKFSLRDAVDAVAGKLNSPRRLIYSRAINLQNRKNER